MIRRKARYVVMSLLAVVIVVLCGLVVPRLVVPSLTERSLSAVQNSKDRIQLQNDRLGLQNDVRATVLQGLAGALLIFGAVTAWWQTQINRQQLVVVQEGQVTERFTRSIDQLGSEKVDVRLGGIYALERIGKNSPADQAVIVEVLSAFVREHAPWRPDREPAAIVRIAASLRSRLAEQPDRAWAGLTTLRFRNPEVQAAMTVLGRRRWPADTQPIWVSRSDLRRAHLVNADFERANFFACNLYGANLENSNLRGAGLNNAILERAFLAGTDLRGANLEGARLRGAMASVGTLWPAGFDAVSAGVVINR